MTEIILPDSHASIIDKWMEQERNGVKFPADFDIVWKIAGYSNKANAKRKLTKLSEGADFLRSDEMVVRPQGGGKKAQLIEMTCDAVKHFCLLAETEQGKAIRQYFIEAEKKWKLVEQHRPDVAHDIEMIKNKATFVLRKGSYSAATLEYSYGRRAQSVTKILRWKDTAIIEADSLEEAITVASKAIQDWQNQGFTAERWRIEGRGKQIKESHNF